MNLRLLSNLLFVIGFVLLGAAAYDYFTQPDGPGALVHEPYREFPNLSVGKNDVTFRLENPTSHPVRIVGYQFC